MSDTPPTSEQTLRAIAVNLRWLLLWCVLPSVVMWVVLDLHSIASDVRSIQWDLKLLRATYEGRKEAREEIERGATR